MYAVSENRSALFGYKGYRGHKKGKGCLPSPLKLRMGRDPFSKNLLKSVVNWLKNYLKLYLGNFSADRSNFSFSILSFRCNKALKMSQNKTQLWNKTLSQLWQWVSDFSPWNQRIREISLWKQGLSGVLVWNQWMSEVPLWNQRYVKCKSEIKVYT
jgi:hypothetical protein